MSGYKIYILKVRIRPQGSFMEKYGSGGKGSGSYIDTNSKRMENQIIVANERLQYLLSSTQAVIYSGLHPEIDN